MSVAALVLDNEAAQALLDVRHPKHGRAAAFLTEVSRRNRRRPGRVVIIVPTAVRVEAGWDRTERTAANANRISRARDHPLDTTAADRAAQLRTQADVSVVDACVGQAVEVAPQPVAVLTSDVDDLMRLRGISRASEVRIIAL